MKNNPKEPVELQEYQLLEKEFAESLNLSPENMVVCSSGTAALHLGLEVLELGEGSTVAVPDFAMVACARAVTLAGLTPVFVDVDPISLNLLPSQIPISTTAVIAVSTYGRKFDVPSITHHQTQFVVEDLAECHGIPPQKSTDVACWSFYRNKSISGEEGGAVYFHYPEDATKARSLRNMGFTDSHDYTHIPRGHNYRMSNLHATPIRRSLKSFYGENMWADGFRGSSLENRRRIEGWYNTYCPKIWQQPYRDSPWVYDFRIPSLGTNFQNRIITTLKSKGIEARHSFKPLSHQEEYRTIPGSSSYPNSLKASTEVIYLPISPGVTSKADCERAFIIVRQCLPSSHSWHYPYSDGHSVLRRD